MPLHKEGKVPRLPKLHCIHILNALYTNGYNEPIKQDRQNGSNKLE
jgi:hypothetical protein